MTRAAAAATLIVLWALVAPPAADAARGLKLGFLDGAYLGADRDVWLDRTAAAGADIVRLDVGWSAPNTPVKPAGFRPRDPADPAYDFSTADAAIRAATARRLNVLLSFTGAPRWAEGPKRPAGAVAGSWRPSPAAVGDYGAALARRYSGSFPDPLHPGRMLPRVGAFQPWNEPNLRRYLAPQSRGGVSVAPALYRRMLSAFYAGVRAVRTDALVVTAGTAPFGDPVRNTGRTPPAAFVRKLLCLRRGERGLRRMTCTPRPRFDVLSHHPYSVGRPQRRAINSDDVSIPDLGKLTRLVRAAERLGTAGGAKRHRLWVTEVSYDSSPPDPDGVPLKRHARYLEETLYLLWRQGVETITWFQVRDEPPKPSFAASNQSGIFLRDGAAKPAQRAFRFPLLAARLRGGRLRVWGRSPVAGIVNIEVFAGGRWQAARSLTVGPRAVFVTRVRAGQRVRARVGSDASLPWTVR